MNYKCLLCIPITYMQKCGNCHEEYSYCNDCNHKAACQYQCNKKYFLMIEWSRPPCKFSCIFPHAELPNGIFGPLFNSNLCVMSTPSLKLVKAYLVFIIFKAAICACTFFTQAVSRIPSLLGLCY